MANINKKQTKRNSPSRPIKKSILKKWEKSLEGNDVLEMMKKGVASEKIIRQALKGFASPETEAKITAYFESKKAETVDA